MASLTRTDKFLTLRNYLCIMGSVSVLSRIAGRQDTRAISWHAESQYGHPALSTQSTENATGDQPSVAFNLHSTQATTTLYSSDELNVQ